MSFSGPPTGAPKRWPQPRCTGNSQMLTGYLAAALRGAEYQPDSFEDGCLIVRNRSNGNLYCVSVVQIGGTE